MLYVESSPKSRFFATKALKHKIPPKLLAGIHYFVKFCALVFLWHFLISYFSEWIQNLKLEIKQPYVYLII